VGLDAIEITMPVEEAFDIRIEDAEVAFLATPRDLICASIYREDASFV